VVKDPESTLISFAFHFQNLARKVTLQRCVQVIYYHQVTYCSTSVPWELSHGSSNSRHPTVILDVSQCVITNLPILVECYLQRCGS
jgi:hypothetical protein